MNMLNTRQKSFVGHIAAGKNATQSAILAGYSKRSARFTASKLLTNANILQQLEELFDKAGLSDEALVDRLKTAIDAGIGVKPTNGDALKGLRMIFDLKNRFPSPQVKAEVTQVDEHMMKLQQMSEVDLMDYLEETSKKTLEYIAHIQERRLKSKDGDDNIELATPVVKQIPTESKNQYITPVIAVPTPRDTNVIKAVGIPVEAKPIKQPTLKLNSEPELSEDEHYHSKVSYPA